MNWIKGIIVFSSLMCATVQAQNLGTPIPTAVTVTFPDSITKFDPSLEVQMYLEKANDAAIIYISGRTSTNTASAQDEALAFKRAASARAYLIDRGVSPMKIMINYISAADFVLDNNTSWGRLANQRVEIEMVFVSNGGLKSSGGIPKAWSTGLQIQPPGQSKM